MSDQHGVSYPHPDVGGVSSDPDPAADDIEPPPDRPRRSRAQVFVPAPEDLPPFEEVVDPIYPRSPEPGPVADPPPVPAGQSMQVPGPGPLADPGVPPPPVLDRSPGGQRVSPSPRPRSRIDRRRLAVVYDVDGPRVRLGLAWFAGVLAATAAGPLAVAAVFAVAAGFAARQMVRAWGSVPWQSDVAAGLAAVPVLAALLGTPALVVAVVLALAVAIGAACVPDGARMPGSGGRLAAAGILGLSVVPALTGGTVVLARSESVVVAAVLLLVASAYEMGDYIVGSGSTNPIEGPLAGVTTATLVALPLALVLVEPYNAGGLPLLAFTAMVCPLGQVVASAMLPGAGAHAPALRRIDTLIVLAPLFAATAGAF